MNMKSLKVISLLIMIVFLTSACQINSNKEVKVSELPTKIKNNVILSKATLKSGQLFSYDLTSNKLIGKFFETTLLNKLEVFTGENDEFYIYLKKTQVNQKLLKDRLFKYHDDDSLQVEQKISEIPIRNFFHVPNSSQSIHIFSQNNFHINYYTWR